MKELSTTASMNAVKQRTFHKKKSPSKDETDNKIKKQEVHIFKMYNETLLKSIKCF